MCIQIFKPFFHLIGRGEMPDGNPPQRHIGPIHLMKPLAALAEYLNIDPTLVRIAFVAGTLLGGPGLVLYIILWMVMPDAD